jgi:hypothetical protein
LDVEWDLYDQAIIATIVERCENGSRLACRIVDGVVDPGVEIYMTQLMGHLDCDKANEGFLPFAFAGDGFPVVGGLQGGSIQNGCNAVYGAWYMDGGDRFKLLTLHGSGDTLVPFRHAVALEGDYVSPYRNERLPGHPGPIQTVVAPGQEHGIPGYRVEHNAIVYDWLANTNVSDRHVETLPAGFEFYDPTKHAR